MAVCPAPPDVSDAGAAAPAGDEGEGGGEDEVDDDEDEVDEVDEVDDDEGDDEELLRPRRCPVSTKPVSCPVFGAPGPADLAPPFGGGGAPVEAGVSGATDCADSTSSKPPPVSRQGSSVASAVDGTVAGAEATVAASSGLTTWLPACS